MITHYGYSDGSGEYYIIIDTDKCTGCGKCTEACPQATLVLEQIFVDLEDKTVATVKETSRRKIKYSCAACKPEKGSTPCMLACNTKAVTCAWKI